MPLLTAIAANWQKTLPALAAVGLAAWIAAFRHEPTSERALFAALLVIYMLHQIEEHLWPGGFREFTNAHVFKSGRSDWPLDTGGVALVNIGYVWLPLALAVAWPAALRWLGLAWVALTLVNGISHIATSARLRIYNPGLVTSLVLFLPFTIWLLWHEAAAGMLSGAEIGLLLVAGVLLHIPVAALFVVPFLRKRAAAV
jgi:Protein of unknown function with HXXEE motif